MRFCFFIFLLCSMSCTSQTQPVSDSLVRLLTLGDSYTICQGLEPAERWPDLVVKSLQDSGYAVELVGNPSVTGYTTDNVIQEELSWLEKTNPTLVTLLIGVNDYVRGYDTSHYRKNLKIILDSIQTHLGDSGQVVAITIPDFSQTPVGKNYVRNNHTTADLEIWNGILRELCAARKIPVVDILPESLNMGLNPDLVGTDGLHPSAKEVRIWAKMIENEIRFFCKKKVSLRK